VSAFAAPISPAVRPLNRRQGDSRERSRSRNTRSRLVLLVFLTSFCRNLPGQTASPTRTFHDPAYHLSFEYPANWIFTQSDGEISTFHLDAHSAPRGARLRAVVAIPENPFPASTFSSAYFYFSVTPHTSAASCAAQATNTTVVNNIPQTRPGRQDTDIAGVHFIHGYDEKQEICITQRDDVYTTRRGGACYRFDMATNNFCGGEVSGVKDVTLAELAQVRAHLTSMLVSIRFDPR
jgi:hypothetical protein